MQCRPAPDGKRGLCAVHHGRVINALLSRIRARSLATASAGDLGPLVTAAAVAVAAPDEAAAGAAAKILLLPLGDIHTRDNRHFRIDDVAHAEAIIAASVQHAGRRDIPVDYDHQLVYAVGKDRGGRAPAAGWIKPGSLIVTAAGIEGEVSWTPGAADALAKREYRYFSPTFTTFKDGRIAAIRFGSLVNDNAIDELPAVAAAAISDVTHQETPVNYAKIAAALGLPADASEEDVLAAIAGSALPAAVMTAAALSPLGTALGLAADATAEEIVTAATAAVTAEPDPAKFVPIAVVTDLQGKLATATAASAATEAEQLITTASADGKLTPAMQGWAKSYAAKDLPGFKTWLATAAVVVSPGAIEGDLETAAAQGGVLTDDEKKICKLTGVTEEKFLAAKKGN